MEISLSEVLNEVRKFAGETTGKEVQSDDLEHEIAEGLRKICEDMFGKDTTYKIPVQHLAPGVYEPVTVWAKIGGILQDKTRIDGNGAYYGSIQVIRVQTNGKIITAWIWINGLRDVDISRSVQWQTDSAPGRATAAATDHDITTQAMDLLGTLMGIRETAQRTG